MFEPSPIRFGRATFVRGLAATRWAGRAIGLAEIDVPADVSRRDMPSMTRDIRVGGAVLNKTCLSF
jgi:hypothetical protein